MKKKKTEAEAATAGQDELNNIIPPERQEELKTLAEEIAELYVTQITVNLTWPKIIYPDDRKQKQDDISEDELQNLQFEAEEKEKRTAKIKQPESLFEEMFFRGCKWKAIAEKLEKDYTDVSKFVSAYAEDKITNRILWDCGFQMGDVGKVSVNRIKQHTGRKPERTKTEIAEIIYNRIMARVQNGGNFEVEKKAVIDNYYKGTPTITEEIKALTKNGELPSKPTLKKWLKEYMDTINEAAEE